VKGPIYRDNSQTLLELKEIIVEFIRNISLIEIPRVSANKFGRVDACIHVRGEEPFLTFVVTTVSKGNLFVLCTEYTHCLR
jgi:hypothetical protein